MDNLLKLIENNPNCEFLQKLKNNYNVFNEIYKACKYTFYKGCGSYLFDGQTYEYCSKMYEKQKLLYNTSKKASNVIEI